MAPVTPATIGCNLVSGAGDLEVGTFEDAGTTETVAVEPAPGGGDRDGGRVDGAPTSPMHDAGPVENDDAAFVTTKLVFVTGLQFSGALGGLEGADERCRAAAAQAGLSSSDWRAWLSTSSVNAAARIEHEGPYALLDGRVVVVNKSQLATGVLGVPIDVTEAGTRADDGQEEARVWTGTSAAGSVVAPDTCKDWTSANALQWGIMGSIRATNASWTRSPGVVETTGGWGCQTKGRLYCFER